MRKFWPFAANFLFFACAAVVLPFLILLYERLGFSGPQIGLLTGITPLVTLVSEPLWANLADNTHRYRLVVSLLIVAAALSLAALTFLTTFWSVLAAILLWSTCFIPVTAFIDSATLAMLAGEQQLYGRVRLGGTFGFGLAGGFAGLLIGRYGLNAALWFGAAMLGLTLAAAQFLEFGLHRPQAAGAQPPARGSVRTLLADRGWLPFLALALAGGMTTVIATNYLFAYMKELGSPETTMGLALTFGTISEVPVLFFGDRLLRRFRPYSLFMTAMVIGGGRLLLFYVVRSPNAVLGVQLLNGLTFPLMWLSGVAYAHQRAPAGLAATAQGLFGAMVYGIGSAVAGFAGGPLIERIGGRATYMVFGVVVLAIVAVVALVQRREPAMIDTPK